MRVLHVAFPRGLFQPVWRRLRRVRGVVDPTIRAADLGVGRAAVDLAVDIRAVATLKRRALACYRSQLDDGDPASFLVPGLFPALVADEWFTLAWGEPLPDGACGPLDGLAAAGAPA